MKINRCIYLGDKNDLHYTNEEHIIPAGLGGKKKLPKGYVSDEANSFFSHFEQFALRNSLLSINRNNNGPGKRGTLDVKKIKEPHILIFNRTSSGAIDTEVIPHRMGFLFRGNAQIINQIYIGRCKDGSIKIPALLLGNISQVTETDMDNFTNQAYGFLLSEHKKYVTIDAPSKEKIEEDFIIIGFFRNRTYVCSSNSRFPLERFFEVVRNKPPIKLILLPSSESTYQHCQVLTDFDNPSFELVYTKTAFNVLAHFQGQEFTAHPSFDLIRDSICNASGLFDYNIEKIMPAWLTNWVQTVIPEKSHFIVLDAYESYVEAYVSFYRERLWHAIRLTTNYCGPSFRHAMICDWQKGEEHFFNCESFVEG